MKTDPVSIDDLPRIYELLRDCGVPHYCTPSVIEENFFADEGVSDALRRAITVDDRLVGLCVATVRSASKRGHIKWIGMDPAYRRRGFGSFLLKTVESALQQHDVDTIRIGAAAPNYLFPGVTVTEPVTKSFLESRGYDVTGEAINMLAPLLHRQFDASPTTKLLANDKIEIRRAEPSDRDGINALLDAHWAAWKPEIGCTFNNDPISLHVAVRQHEVLGFSAYDANNVGCGWFGPMGTDPQATGMGIGRALLQRCLNDLRQQGHSAAIIPWVGPVEFYRRHSEAEISETFWRMEKIIRRG